MWTGQELSLDLTSRKKKIDADADPGIDLAPKETPPYTTSAAPTPSTLHPSKLPRCSSLVAKQ